MIRLTDSEKMHAAPIYMLSFVSMVSLVVSPALAMIAKEYSWASNTQIQLMISLPSLATIAAALVTPALQRRYSLRTLFLSNLAVMLFFGVAPFFIKSFGLILVTRVISGFSVGFLSILLNVAITTRFHKQAQGRVMGFKTVFASISAILITYFGGVLANLNWRLTFLMFLIVLPAIAVIWLKLKKEEPERSELAGSREKTRRFQKPQGITLFLCVTSFLYIIFLQCFLTNAAFLVESEHFGTSVVSGTSLAFYNLAGLLCGLLLSRMKRLLHGSTLFFGYLVSAVGILLAGLAGSSALVYAGAVFGGFGMATYLGIGPLDITGTVSREKAAGGIALLAITQYLGQFLSPLVVTPLAALFAKDSVRMRFYVSAAVLFALAVLYELVRRTRFAACYREPQPALAGEQPRKGDVE